jgi:hypothetical protein
MSEDGSRSPRRALSFSRGQAPSVVSLIEGEALVCTALASRGEALALRSGARELARSLPLEGTSGAVTLAPGALSVPRWGYVRVDLVRVFSAAGGEGSIVVGSFAVVRASALRVARALVACAALAPASFVLLVLLSARSSTASMLIWHSFVALIAAAPLALGVQRWPTGVRHTLSFDAPRALCAALLAWTALFAARSQSLVVHNLTGRSSGTLPEGRSAWLRFAARGLPRSECTPDGPVCLRDDPRAFVPRACGDVPSDEPLSQWMHSVRYAGCPSRFEVVEVEGLEDRGLCATIRDGQCCIDLRGPRCERARAVVVEQPWPRGTSERPRDPACPTRELTPWRVRVRGGAGLARALRAARESPATSELCVDLERWGSAHEIIIEDGPRVWRAARRADARPRAMRVAIPALEQAERATVRVAYTVREDQEAPAIEGAYERTGAIAPLLLPAKLTFASRATDGARASLRYLNIDSRNRDASPDVELDVGPGRPALNLELWPGLACGAVVRVRDEERSLGEVTLPCARETQRRGEEDPWVLWRFALRPSTPELWRLSAREMRSSSDGGALLFRSVAAPSEVWLAFRGWDGVSSDLRVYSREGRAFGIEQHGDVQHGRGPWRMVAGPPPMGAPLCCQLDGVWTACPADFNDYWRCQGTSSTRPGCAEAFRRCTYIDWVAERAARRASERGARR